MTDVQSVRSLLQGAGLSIVEEKGIEHGTQLVVSNGARVNVWDKGTTSVQGKKTAKEAAERVVAEAMVGTPNASRKVFVVYGHDREDRDALERLLLRWKLEPLILDDLPSEGATIIEKLEKYTRDCSFGVVLASPDDEGFRAGHPDEKKHRVRQNVTLELGMLLVRLGRENVAILMKQSRDMERPSDIQGLIYLPYLESVDEAGVSLAKELSARGIHVAVESL